MVNNCSWSSGTSLVPQDQIESLLSLLLEAENRRWLSSISPVNSSEHDLSVENENRSGASFSDTGSLLLRHGKCITQIHRFFQHLEPGHYQLTVTAQKGKPDRPGSWMKVVAGHDDDTCELASSADKMIAGTSPDSVDESSETQFTEKDPAFELYQNALLCAQYPVLSAVKSSSPYSPSSPSPSSQKSPRSLQPKRFSYSASSSLFASNARTRGFSRRLSTSSDTGYVSPEVSVPISAEELRELVRNAFKLTKMVHLHYEKVIQGKKWPKDPAKLLVEELLRQQLVLERNHHPYYRVLAFVDKNAYNEWCLEEKNKIQALIRRFWLNPLPPMPELPLHISDKHSEYKDLMHRLIMLESKSKTSHPVHGGVSLTAPLTSKSLRLLKEFRLRYGVGEVFCKISYLTYLVEHFENALWYIEHVRTTLQDLVDLTVIFSTPEIYVEKEFLKLVSVLSLLLKHTEYSLTRIRRLFPENSPDGGVVALVALFEATLEAFRLLQIECPVIFSKLDRTQEFFGHPEKRSLSDLLPSYLRTEMEGRYERVKVIAADELKEHFLSSTLSPQVMLNLIMHIQDEVNYYNNYYKQAFSRYFDVMELAAGSFYSLLMADVRQLCANPPRSLRRDEVELCMLNLAFRLSKLDQDWANHIPVRIQTWREPFKQFALEWLDAIGRNFQKLIPLTTEVDLWHALEVNCSEESRAENRNKSRIPQAPQGAGQSRRLSLTPSLNSAFSVVNPASDPAVKTTTSRMPKRNSTGKQPLSANVSPQQRSLKRRQASLLYGSSSEEEQTASMLTAVVDVHTPKLFTASRTQGNQLSNGPQQVNVEVHVPRARKVDNKNTEIRERQFGGKDAIDCGEKMISGSKRAKDQTQALEGRGRSDEIGSRDLLTVREVCSEARPSYKDLDPERSGTSTKETKLGEQTSNTEDALLKQQSTKDAALVQHGTKKDTILDGLGNTEDITAEPQNNKHGTSLGEPNSHRIITLSEQTDSGSNVFCQPGNNREVASEHPNNNAVSVVDQPGDSTDATIGLQCDEGTMTCDPGNTTHRHLVSNIRDFLVEQNNNDTNEPVFLGQSADSESTVVSKSNNAENILGQQHGCKGRDLIIGTESGLMCGSPPVLIQSSNVLERGSEESTEQLERNSIVNQSVEQGTKLNNGDASAVSQHATVNLSDEVKEIKNFDGMEQDAVSPTEEVGFMDHSDDTSETRNTPISASPAKSDLDVDLDDGISIGECANTSSKRSGSSVASTSPRHPGTPFENNSECSDTDTSCNSSDSFHFIDDKWNRERMLDRTAAATSVPRNTCLGREAEFDTDLLESVRGEAQPFPTSSQGDVRSMVADAHNVTGPIEDIIGKSACENCLSRQNCSTECQNTSEMVGNSQEAHNEIGISHERKTAPVTIPTRRTIEGKVSRAFDNVPGGDSSSCGTRTTRTSERGSFVSALASPNSDSSVRIQPSSDVVEKTSSQGSIGSFHSAKSQVTEPAIQQAGSQEDTDDRSKRRRARENSKLLPISSSFVDVICAVHRLTAFACHLCKILCLDETCASKTLTETESVASVKEESRNQSLAIKRVLGNKLIQVLCSFVQLYSDNVIGLDICGVEDDILFGVVGERVFRHVRSQRQEGLLMGCRFNPSARQHCNTRGRTGAFIPPCDNILANKTIPGGCEPLTEKMGIRLSNVSILRKILPWLLDYVASCVSGPESLAPGYGDSERSATYCQNGPSLDGVPASHIGEGLEPETSTAGDPAMLHLCRLETAQVRLMTYRINQFFKRILHTLLELKLTGFNLTRRLSPAAGFLSRVLQRFHGVLSQECFNQLLINTWNSVAQDFSEEAHFLMMKKSLASQHSRLLLQAAAYMMDFFRRGGRDGLTPDILAANVEPTLKLFGLYTSSTDRLIAMYRTISKHVLFMQQQYRADEFTSSTSTHSYQSRVNAPADDVIQGLYSDLHATCKCFTGTDFIDWVKVYVRENGYDNLGICIGSTTTETGLELGQYLLNRGFIICVATPPILNQQTSRVRTEQQEEEDDEEEEERRYSSERGKVFVNGSIPPDMKINDIVITNRSSLDSSADSGSRSVTRTTEASSTGFDSHDDADDEGDDGDAFQDSIDEILHRCASCQSQQATFYNNPKAFYKFICEEDSGRSHLRFREGISDRLNMSIKLEQILCVLYSRKDTDKEARKFLKNVPSQVLVEVVRREKEAAEAYLSPSAGRCRCPFWACNVS